MKKGIVESVPEASPVSNQFHYLPHHAVVRRDKTTTKLRILYDASVKSVGPSLNDLKFNQLILDILLRFRAHRFALTAGFFDGFCSRG